MMPSPRVQLGIDRHLAEGLPLLRHRRVGLLTNPSGVTHDLVATVDALQREIGRALVALFSPEHGPAGVAADADPVASGYDARRGLPVHSLYGPTLRPTPDMLAGLDVIAVDIQDVGVRFYTYAWTVTYVLEAAAAADVAVVIFDRPNPLGGLIVQGPLLSPGYASFVGRFSIPLRHGMTLGELAGYINAVHRLGCRLTVVPMSGWRRAMTWEDTGLCWVPPSPALPTLDAVRVYPGTCLIEGTNLSEGRGTALPFQLIGAPWVDEAALADALRAEALAGVRFRPALFVPRESKWAGQACRGVQVHVTDLAHFDPLRIGLTLIAAIQRLHPARFEWLTTSWEGKPPHFDLLIGNGWTREALSAGTPIAAICRRWQDDAHEFARRRREHLIYLE